jgi:hypothetical protein
LAVLGTPLRALKPAMMLIVPASIAARNGGRYTSRNSAGGIKVES